MTLDSMMQEQVSRELLRHAVSTAIFCPLCQGILDVRDAVLLSDEKRSAVACVPCFDRSPIKGKFASVEVYDGRILYPRKQKALKPRKGSKP